MRVTFIPPSEEDFKRLFLSQPLRRGGGLEDISIYYPGRRRGGGILSAISGVARKVIPFLFRAVSPSAKEFGKAVITDMITEKRPLRESLKRHGIKAARSAGLRILNGSGRVRNRSIRKKKKKKKGSKVRNAGRRRRVESYKNDVYELL